MNNAPDGTHSLEQTIGGNDYILGAGNTDFNNGDIVMVRVSNRSPAPQPSPPNPTAVPSLDTYGVLAFAALLAGAGMLLCRRMSFV